MCFTFSKQRRTWSFHVAVLQRTAKKCTNIYNARAQLLFCSLNLLFRDVLVAVAVAVVFCVRSLISTVRRQFVLGLPLLLLPSGLPVKDTSALLIFSSLRTWPNHLQRLSAIMSETGIIPAFLYRSLFLIFSGQKIRKLFSRNLSGICPTGKHHVQSSSTFLRHKVEQLGHYS